MGLPLYKVTIHLILSGFRDLPLITHDIQNIIIKIHEDNLDRLLVSAYCNFDIGNDIKHHIFVNGQDNSTSLGLMKRIKEPDYSPVKWHQDGNLSTYFSFETSVDFEYFLKLLWEFGITKNILTPIDFYYDCIKTNIL